MVDEIVTRQELIDAKRDARDLGKAVNEKVVVSPRYGADFKSLPMITAEAQGTINEWQDAINTIVVNDGVPALAVSDASGVTQQNINDLTGAPYRVRVGGYNIGERVVLENGDIVRSTVAGNTVDPNVDMAGWVKTNAAKNIEIKNAQNPNAPAIIRSVQQEIDDGAFNVARMGAKGSTTFDSTEAFLKAQEEAIFLGAKTLYVPASANPYNISSTILKSSQGTRGINIKGEGIGMSTLRWVGGAGRMIDAFDAWQYGFEMSSLTLTSQATNKTNVVDGSVGLHIEKNQSSGKVTDVLIRGFDTNIDVGVHAQFLTFRNVYSREGHTLVNAYGQNSDKNVWLNCVFYSPTKIGTVISSPRNTFLDCWWGAGPGWTDTDYIDVLVGYQQVRPEDVGKSSSLISTSHGHAAQHSALIRPRFERNGAVYTSPYIKFKDINERLAPSNGTLSDFIIDNPVFPNAGASSCIHIEDVRHGLRIKDPIMHKDIPTLISDTPASDGGVQYVAVTGSTVAHTISTGMRSYLTHGDAAAKFGSTSKVSLTTGMITSSGVVKNEDAVNEITQLTYSGGVLGDVYNTRPSSVAQNGKFYIKASSKNIGALSIRVSDGGDVLFRMRDIPISILANGVSIVIPNSKSRPLTVVISQTSLAEGEVMIEDFSYYS